MSDHVRHIAEKKVVEQPRTAVVTGSSSGIGEQITKVLLRQGFQVFGLARDFDKQFLTEEAYFQLRCDLRDTGQIQQTVRRIQSETKHVHMLVNNAGLAHFGLHDQLQPSQIADMVATNLTAPLLLTRLLLPSIKKTAGFIINLSSVTAHKVSTHGCAYAATKAGLSHFGTSLFEEVRKHGVKVVNLHPDMTQTPFYDHLPFREGNDPDTYLTADDVARVLDIVLAQSDRSVITDMTLRPQKFGITKK